MRYLYVSCHPHLRSDSNAGYATHIRETVAALRRRGHEVETWIAGELHDPQVENGGGAGRRSKSLLRRVVPRFLWTGLRDLSLLRHDRLIEERLRERVATLRPDAIYERAAYLSSAGVRVAAEMGVPLVLEVNAPYVEERRHLNGSGPLDGRGRRWEAEVLGNASSVVTVSSALRDRLVQTTGVPAARFHVQPNGVDAERFHRGVASARADLGIPEDAFVVCFVGSFIRWHRLDVLVDAIARLGGGGRPVHGLLVGDGEVRPALEERARAAGAQIHFTGTVAFDTVPDHIQAADVCVIPGHAWYCSPIKLFEYGGVGKAVVTLDSEPVREVAEAGRDCVLFDGSGAALEGALRTLMEDAGQRAELADNLHRAVTERFTWDAAGGRIEGWIADAVAAAEPARTSGANSRPVLP